MRSLKRLPSGNSRNRDCFMKGAVRLSRTRSAHVKKCPTGALHMDRHRFSMVFRERHDPAEAFPRNSIANMVSAQPPCRPTNRLSPAVVANLY